MASAKQSAHPQKVHTLKRLQPVATLWGISQEATRAGLHISLYFYQGAKAYVPSGLRPRLDQVEDTIQSNFTPLASRVQDVANELIYFADDEVGQFFGRQESCVFGAPADNPDSDSSEPIDGTCMPSTLLSPLTFVQF